LFHAQPEFLMFYIVVEDKSVLAFPLISLRALSGCCSGAVYSDRYIDRFIRIFAGKFKPSFHAFFNF